MTNIKFAEWLTDYLKTQRIKPVELARMAKLDPGAISRILTAERSPTPKTLESIAKALDIPSETVFRAAGLLNSEGKKSEYLEQINHIMNAITDQEQVEILEYAKMRHRLSAKRENYETSKDKKNTGNT